MTRPRTALLGKIPRTNVFRNIQQYPDATRIPEVVIVRVDSAIYFSNSNYIKDRYVYTYSKYISIFSYIYVSTISFLFCRILRWLTEEEELLKENKLPEIEHLIVEMSRKIYHIFMYKYFYNLTFGVPSFYF